MPRPRNPTHCTAPGCSRPSRAGGLCRAHYQQRLRGQKLRAIEARVARIRLSSVRVSERCAARLLEAGQDTGDPASVAASRILEAWALGLLVSVPRPATPPHTQQTAGGTGAGEAAGSAPAKHPGSRWPSDALSDIAAAVLSAPSPVNIWAKDPAGVWHLATETYPDAARVCCTDERVPAGTFQAVPLHHDLGVLAQVDGAPWRAAVCSICQSIARGDR